MRFALASDVHLEFGFLQLKNTENADVLILAGDICVADDLRIDTKIGQSYRQFFEDVSIEFPRVIYIMGNHEHYGGDFAKTEQTLRDEFEFLPNITFLNRQHVDIDGVRFIGSTLWTSANNRNPTSMMVMKGAMNDYVLVENSANMVTYRVPTPNDPVKVKFKERVSKLSVEDTVEDHEKCVSYIDQVIKDTPLDMPVVVVGHHLPSFLSVPEEYVRQFDMNGAYASNLDNFILDRPQIKFWIHGHTHQGFDYRIGSTRIVCNPRGYKGHERIANNFMLKFYDI